MPHNIRTPGQAMEKLLIETSLSILIILAHLASDPAKITSVFQTKPAGVLAAAYTAATLVKVKNNLLFQIYFKCQMSLKKKCKKKLLFF